MILIQLSDIDVVVLSFQKEKYLKKVSHFTLLCSLVLFVVFPDFNIAKGYVQFYRDTRFEYDNIYRLLKRDRGKDL